MTYSDASSYANEHYPKDEFDTFEDWLEDSTNNQLNTPELLDEPEYVDLMERYWIDEVGSLSRDEEKEDIEPERPREDIMDNLERASGSREISIDSGFIVTSKGTEPVKVIDVTKDGNPPIVITESQATSQKVSEPLRERQALNIPRVNITNRFSNVATRLRAIGTDILGFLRRKR